MKTIAFYLPQFHSIPENDEWWGKGFTEWSNVRASKPQFKGHIQPEIPYNNNYYNLLDPETQVNQAELAKEYGLSGFCYYHYWFEGKLLLEKPMENMLQNKQVDIPFCICWANETWARTWDGKEQDILIKQNYNEDEEGWKRHFDYLLPFFKDSRYIKHDGRPMILLYKPQLILNCKEMLSFWRKLAKKEGFPDLYIGYQHHSAFDSDMESYGFDFGIEFEPFYTVRELKKNTAGALRKCGYAIKHPKWIYRKFRQKFLKKPTIYDYDEIWKRILNRKPAAENIMPGAFTSWDNTPRRGNQSNVFLGASPQKFAKYFQQQVKHAKEVYGAEYLFINAWNEWAEGAHLEPDTYNGFG
ncbi:MAG: glycoside hydrolase family 99-like domain-containing protein, partial [Butyrivibrio sp.]